MKTSGYFTPVRIVFWVIMLPIPLLVIYSLCNELLNPNHGSDRAGCVMQQRNIQQAVRSYANMNSLKIGDPIEWSKIIGPGLFLEKAPSCPVHGSGAYSLPSTIPLDGVVVITCKDPIHVALVQGSWESYFSADRVIFLLVVSGLILFMTILPIRMARRPSAKLKAPTGTEDTFE